MSAESKILYARCQPLLAYFFVDESPIPDAEVKNICYELSSILPSLKIVKILIHLVSLVLTLLDFVTDCFFYQTLISAEDMNNFQIPYLIFLILSAIPFFAEVLTSVFGIFVAAIENKKPSPSHQIDLKISSLLLEDLPFSLIIYYSLIRSENCGYVVSLSYSKSAKWSSVATILGCVWRLFWLCRNTLDCENYQNHPISKWGPIAFIALVLFELPELLYKLIARLFIWIYLRLGFSAERSAINRITRFLRSRKLQFITIWMSSCIVFYLLVIPFIVALFNLGFFINLGHLADVSGCAFFTLNISAVILFPIANGSSNCVENEYYSMKMGISGTSEGPRLLEANKLVITGDCNRLLPMELDSHYSISPNDSCLVFVSAMYSTKDFVPEFNLAFLIKKPTSNNSICVKPYFESGDISFSAPWIQSSKTAERVGNSYCGSKNFTACSMPAIPNRDGNSPCFDCNRNCYSWVTLEKKPIIFQSFEGKLIVRHAPKSLWGIGKEPMGMDKEYAVRHNVKLATYCDVDSDWKREKLYCTPI